MRPRRPAAAPGQVVGVRRSSLRRAVHGAPDTYVCHGGLPILAGQDVSEDSPVPQARLGD